MPSQSLRKIIFKLPFEKKLIGAGAIIMGLSLFFPWYQDVDNFKIGAIYTGFTGPLYAIGYTLLTLSVLSAFFIIADALERRYFHIETRKLYLGFGILSFYLLFLTNSIYFSVDFGMNITFKQSEFGMFMALFAASLFTIGGYMNTREQKKLLREFVKETRGKVMPFMEQQKPREGIKKPYSGQNPTTSKSSQPVRETLEKMRTQSGPALEKEPAPAVKKPQPFRMDL